MEINSTVEKNEAQPAFFKARWFWAIIILLVLIFGSAWIVFSRTITGSQMTGGKAVTLEAAAVAGHPAPDFALKTLEGDVIRLSDFKGKPVLVNFWATWCGPCRAEFPDMQRASVDNADKLVIIGINNTSTDQLELIPGFLDEFGVTFPIVLDETGETAKAYEIFGLPTSIFIDANGIVIEVRAGSINKAYIEAKLSEL